MVGVSYEFLVMASPSAIRNYPPRLYEAGKTPMKNISMNHSCHLLNLHMVEEAVGVDAWDVLKESDVGVIIKAEGVGLHFLSGQKEDDKEGKM
ncbi:unnamed protein product [Eruca vesicaria subsp. sativa]|uniref:Uncharacterized protein n=1 Tax=Eruca vesicaria subsp. sativa TaxID=29727 RepID=A0ABC8KLT1_ERUVS|nr:unnamed protein product [Eruca vesicaria subsp. sativa]